MRISDWSSDVCSSDLGTFSLTLAHWLRHPRRARAYAWLVREENRLVGTRQSVGLEQAWWRPLHMALAYVFVFGLIIHVVTVTFFAGYVADGGAIRSEEHTSELQSLMRISYAVFCLKKKKIIK